MEKPSPPCVHCTCWWEFEGTIASLLGSGTYLEYIADVALQITKALLNWKWFCAGGRSTVNLFNLYATMLRVDVEEEDEEGSVLLVPDTTCLLGSCKNTP